MAEKKKGLGKGIEALFESTPVVEPTSKDEKNDGVLYVAVDEIAPNENQPRKVFDQEKLDELALSIKEHGIIQPIVIRSKGTGFEIVAGERRFRAARKAGLKKVPCVVKELDEDQNLLIAIIENMQREDLNPIEEAEGLNKMVETYGLTQEAVSKSVGKSRPYITNSLRLLKLPDEIKELTEKGLLSAGHARAIAAIPDIENQIRIAKRAVSEGLSVRAIEKMAEKPERKEKSPKIKDPNLKRIEGELQEALGTKVNIVNQGRRGKIEIEYYSREELDRLLELLK